MSKDRQQQQPSASRKLTRRNAIGALLASTIDAGGATRAPLTQLSVSDNKRFLQDAAGKPFFLVGDSPQNLPIKLAIPDFDGYMAECKSAGFNLLWICIDGQRWDRPFADDPGPIDRAGRPMMNARWDIGTLNDGYFLTIDAMLKSAAAHGIYCMLMPLSECQWSKDNMAANSAEKWRAYGLYLGKRYRSTPNIIWQFGNDRLTEAYQHEIVRGIKQGGDTHLMTVNWRPARYKLGSGWMRRYEYGETWVDLSAWYMNAPLANGGSPSYWQKVEYERPNPMPSFLTEGQYQPPFHQATDLICRMQHYAVALGGGCGGAVYGSGWLSDKIDYETYRSHKGRLQGIHFQRLFTSRAWTTLVPDYSHEFITRGYGTLSPTTTDYVSAAANADSIGIAYCPAAGTITADLSRFAEPVTACWYDPTNGKFTTPRDAKVRNKGRQQFTTPGKNSDGDSDWVLVLETHPPS